MSRKKISTTIYVTPEQNELLRLLHDRTKVPIAVYIREGIDLVLREYAHQLPGQLTLTRDTEPSVDRPADGPSSATSPAQTTRSDRSDRASRISSTSSSKG
jgi:hypothetical protein